MITHHAKFGYEVLRGSSDTVHNPFFLKTFLWRYNEQRNRTLKSQSYCKQSSQHHQPTILCTKAWGHDLSDFPTNQSAEIQAAALPAQAPEETHNQKQIDMPQSVCLPDLLNADFVCVCVCVCVCARACVCMCVYVCAAHACMSLE